MLHISRPARARIRETVDFAESVKEAQYAGASERRVSLSWGYGKMIGGEDYLLQMVVQDVYFHVSMAYVILRHNGVNIGKRGLSRSNQPDRRPTLTRRYHQGHWQSAGHP